MGLTALCGAGGVRLHKRVADCLKRFLRGVDFKNQVRLLGGEKVRLWALHGSHVILNNADPHERARIYEAQRSAEKSTQVSEAVADFDSDSE